MATTRPSCLLALTQYHLGQAEAVHADRDPAIDRDLGQHRADLIGCEAVAQGAANVGLEFLEFPERGDHAEIEDRALARAQRVVAPGFAPTILGDEALEIAVEVIGALKRAIDIVCAEHLAAHAEAAVIGVLVHGSFLRFAPAAGKRREQGFDCGLGKRAAAHRRIGREVGTRGVFERCRFYAEQRRAGEFVHRLLLQALGLELGRLDLGAKELRARAGDEGRRRLQRPPHGAQWYDRQIAPGSDPPFELRDVCLRQRPLLRGVPHQKQQQIDVDARLLLQRDAGVGDLVLAVKPQREPPERRSRGRRWRFGRTHARAPSGVMLSDFATSSTCVTSVAASGTPFFSRSLRRAARPVPGTRISSLPGSRRDEASSRMWRSTSALNTSGGTKRATSSAITNCPTLPSPPTGAAKSRMSRPNAAPLSGPANSPMMIESPLPL